MNDAATLAQPTESLPTTPDLPRGWSWLRRTERVRAGICLESTLVVVAPNGALLTFGSVAVFGPADEEIGAHHAPDGAEWTCLGAPGRFAGVDLAAAVEVAADSDDEIAVAAVARAAWASMRPGSERACWLVVEAPVALRVAS